MLFYLPSDPFDFSTLHFPFPGHGWKKVYLNDPKAN